MPTTDASPDPLPDVDAGELHAVKVALLADPTDAGVGVLHLPTNRIHLLPSSQTRPVGHDSLVKRLRFVRGDCLGFVIVVDKATGGFRVENVSGLNGTAGGPNPFQMPVPQFDSIVHALHTARV